MARSCGGLGDGGAPEETLELNPLRNPPFLGGFSPVTKINERPRINANKGRHNMSTTPAALPVTSPNEAMKTLLVSRETLYRLINTGELESYTEGRARRITNRSIAAYQERRLAAEAERRNQKAAA